MTLKRFLHATLRIFFSEITVIGAEHIAKLPPNGSFVLVANHANALIDPALLLALSPRPLRFLAKSTLWSVPGMRTLLNAARVIPVYRKMDAGVDTTQNDQTFAHCTKALAQGEAIALFPEGITHSEPSLQPLKTGAARIVISAEDENPGLIVPILPVGLTFDAKDRFRSRVLIAIGEPLSSQAARRAHPDDARAAVRALTQAIDTELRRVTLNYPSWEEAGWIEKAAALYARQLPQRASEASVAREVLLPAAKETVVGAPTPHAQKMQRKADEFAIRHRFATLYPRLKELAPQQIERARRTLCAYEDLLASVDCTSEQDARAAHSLRRARLRLALRLPLAALGLLLNWIPYRIAGWIGEHTSRDLTQPATHKFVAGVLLLPLFWLFEAWLAARCFGRGAGLALLALAPSSGYVVLRFQERRRNLRAVLRFQYALHTQKGFEEELIRRRHEVVSAIEALRDAQPEIFPEPSQEEIS